jgi:tetratricopeptide (TPR) repeat protein
MPVNENAYICVETFQLKQGDIFISGSDGRDDVIVTNPLGEKILNTDEKAFLRIVENAEGDLNAILTLLTKDGELTDDLSLLRINLNKNPFPFEVEDLEDIINSNPTIEKIDQQAVTIANNEYLLSKVTDIKKLKHLIFNYTKLEKYNEAIKLGKEYLDLMPADVSMIYRISESLKKLKHFEEAIELGERLRLRRKQNINNLINLAECYTALNQYDRAKLLLHDALQIDKANVPAIEMLESISV